MKVAIIQSNYLPWKGYFDIIHDADVFCFYDEMKYTKNDWRNRNKIYSKNGLHWLTIPIYRDAVKEKISEVKLEDASWQSLHYTTLVTSYSKAPYFSQLESFLHDFYRDHTWHYLSELNHYSIKKIAEYLGIKTKFVNSKDFNLRGDRVERLIILLKDLGATEYISGPSAKDYLKGSEHLFEVNNIKLTFKDYVGYPAYRQLAEPFENYVSIVDTIANVAKVELNKYIFLT